MTPISELRGALPLAINVFGMPWYEAFGLAVLGNMIPVPVILLGLKGIIKIAWESSGSAGDSRAGC